VVLRWQRQKLDTKTKHLVFRFVRYVAAKMKRALLAKFLTWKAKVKYSVVIWTNHTLTLPASQAVSVHPDLLTIALVEVDVVLWAKELFDSLRQDIGWKV